MLLHFVQLWFVWHCYRGQEASEDKLVTEGATTWAEQTDAEEKAAAAERRVYFIIWCTVDFLKRISCVLLVLLQCF